MTDQPKRRRKGEGTIYFDPRANRWIGRLRLEGKARFVTALTEDGALAKLAELRVNLAKGREPKNTRETIGAYLDRWLPLQTHLAASTAQTYKGYIVNHIKPALGKIRLVKLSPLQVQEWINERERAKLSPRSIEQMRAVLRKALHDAERWELVDRNVARLVTLPRRRHRQIKPLTPQEARDFLKAIEDHPLEALYLTAIATGLRQGELLGLRWDYLEGKEHVQDVDLDRGTLTVHYALDRTDGKWVLKPPKTDMSQRTIVLPEIAREALRRHRAQQDSERKALEGDGIIKLSTWGLVFCRPTGDPLHKSSVTHELQRLLEQAKLPRQRFHDLRHLSASLLIAQGASMKDVKDMLGHSQIALTANLYSHLYEESKRDIARRMDEILGG